jgi:dTDP-4-amino-4,6-dideoxygalactose transaminase
MAIPLVDLRAQYDPLKGQILEGIERVFEGMHLFLGDNVQALEKEFAAYCGAEYGIGVCDGTAALHIILRAMEIGPGDEVITVSHTFIATAEAIILAGATPVFVDVCPDTYLMDTSQVEAKITPRTKAIMPVHLYGQTAEMDPILEIAKRHGLRVIEDCAQAHGATSHGRRAGSMGDAAGFSFYYAKNLGAYGEGGFISTSDPEVARKARMIRDHGSEQRYLHELIGFNGRLDEIQAVVLRAKLPFLEQWNTQRRQHAADYTRFLEGAPVVTPFVAPENGHIYHQFVIRTAQRDALQAWLKEQGIGTGIHYPIPVHMQHSMSGLGYHSGDFPVTEKLVGEILSLPMYAELREDQVHLIADRIAAFFKR